MFLMYVDESGDAGLSATSPTRYFVLSGLIVHELRWAEYLDKLIGFRRSLKERFGMRLRDEFHASAMITSPGVLRHIPKHQRLEMLRLYADQLASMTDLNIINIVVDKQGKRATYDPFEMAWKALIQRFENTMSHRNFRGPLNSDERGMLIPDATDNKRLRSLLRKMRHYNPVTNQAQYGAGSRNLQIRTIIEDPYIKDSAESYFIQSADLIAYLLYQKLSPNAYIILIGWIRFCVKWHQPLIRKGLCACSGNDKGSLSAPRWNPTTQTSRGSDSSLLYHKMSTFLALTCVVLQPHG
jgi:hypothetical protein